MNFFGGCFSNSIPFQLSLAYFFFWLKIDFNNNGKYETDLYVDCANGVGAPKLKVLAELMANSAPRSSALSLHLFNQSKSSTDILNHLVSLIDPKRYFLKILTVYMDNLIFFFAVLSVAQITLKYSKRLHLTCLWAKRVWSESTVRSTVMPIESFTTIWTRTTHFSCWMETRSPLWYIFTFWMKCFFLKISCECAFKNRRPRI